MLYAIPSRLCMGGGRENQRKKEEDMNVFLKAMYVDADARRGKGG